MATFTARSNLMQNAFPAGQLSLQGKFCVVGDDAGEHMIFSVDKRGKLCLVLKGEDGHNELINLSTSFSIDEAAKITALAVTQSRGNLVYLAFAVSRPDSLDDLYVLKPTPAARLAWLDPAVLRAALYTGQQGNVAIRDILMGNGNDPLSGEYPELYLTVKGTGKFTQDVWAVTVNNSTASWKREERFEMPCNPEEVISKCIAIVGNPNPNFKTIYRGLFVLYKQASTTVPLQLRFVGLDFSFANPTPRSFEVPVPAGARFVASYDNPEGFTDLLVCADTLLWRSAVDCFTESQNPYQRPLIYHSPEGETSYELMSTSDPKQVSVAQAGNKISIWTLDQSALLSYQEFQIFAKPPLKGGNRQSPPQELSPRIPLLEQSSNSDRFACMQDSRLGQKLFVVNDNGMRMSMLQQSIETRIWQSPVDVMIPNSDEIVEFLSHTVSIQIQSESKVPIHDQKLLLCCSTSAELLVNGASVRGSPAGTIVKTDEQGSLTVIIPADGIAAPVLNFRDVPGNSHPLGGRIFNVDPMQKLWDEMAQVKGVEDLRNLKLPDGTPFVKPEMNDSDLQKAVKSIQDLYKARQDLASEGSQTLAATTASADGLWGAWLWIKTKLADAYDWAVEKIGAAYKFVLKIAGKVWEFILETFPQVGSVLQSILETISKGWEALKGMLEDVFAWEDILSVKNALVNITTAGLIMGSDVFANLEKKADECFDDLRTKVRNLKRRSLPKDLTSIQFSKDPPMPAGMDDKKVADILKSPQAQYGAYHLRHSASSQSDSKTVGFQSRAEGPFDRLYNRLSGIWDSVTALAIRFGANVLDLFSNKEFNLDVLIAKVGLEFVEDALGVMQKVIAALLGSLGDLVLALADAMNANISIPVIGPLYSTLTKGSRFSALDIVCLLLAIPSTIAYKAIIGPLPKDTEGYQQLVKADAMKGALDLRMGRIKAGEVPSKPPYNLASSPTMNSHQVTRTSNPFNASRSYDQASVPIALSRSPALQMSVINSHHAPAEKTETNDIGLSRAAVDQAVMQKTRGWFAETATAASRILQILLPFASEIYTIGYTLPKASISGGIQGVDAENLARRSRKPTLKLLMKLVFWVGHGAVICYPKFKDLNKDLETLASAAFQDNVFGWKFVLWAIPGIFPIGGHLFNEYYGQCAEAAASITQVIGLIAMHVDVYAVVKEHYPWYRCPEEYVNALAKMATVGVVLTRGIEPYTLGFAYTLTIVGKNWTIHRLGLEWHFASDGVDRSIAIDASV